MYIAHNTWEMDCIIKRLEVLENHLDDSTRDFVERTIDDIKCASKRLEDAHRQEQKRLFAQLEDVIKRKVD